MIKKFTFISVVQGTFLLFFCGFANAYQYQLTPADIYNTEGWVENAGTYSITVTGAEAYSSLYSNATGDGAFASIAITDYNCLLFCMARLDKYVGTYGGNDLRAEVMMSTWDGSHRMEYRLRTRDRVTGDLIEEIARGYFGNHTGQYWALGEFVNLAVAIEGNELIFYSGNHDQIAKVQMLTPITPYATSDAWKAFVYSEGATDSISAAVKSFNEVTVTP